MQHVKAFCSQDSGFWDEFNKRVNEFQEIGEYAAGEGVYLDFKPQNFGFLNDEFVYVDTTDASAVKNNESGARGEMADALLRGIEEAPVSANEYNLRHVARDLDPSLANKYSKR